MLLKKVKTLIYKIENSIFIKNIEKLSCESKIS